jgi:CBS domain-containing protein
MGIERFAPRVRQVMTDRPRTVRRTTSLQTLRLLFLEYGFNAFPVVDDGDALAGIVTKLDLLRTARHDTSRLLPDLRALWAERVDDIMRGWVLTVAPGDPVTVAMDRMLSAKLRSLPVVERQGRRHDRVVGMVSCGDVLRVMTLDARDAG